MRVAGIDRVLVPTACAAFAAMPAHAQFAQTLSPGVPVQAGAADVGPLATSLRLVPLDLRQEADFSRVYQLDDQRFARQAGGLIAVFPRSVYSATDSGLLVEIPPGTVFQIGELPASQPPPEPSAIAAGQRIDRRANAQPTPRASDGSAHGVWEDESARRARIARLLGVTDDQARDAGTK